MLTAVFKNFALLRARMMNTTALKTPFVAFAALLDRLVNPYSHDPLSYDGHLFRAQRKALAAMVGFWAPLAVSTSPSPASLILGIGTVAALSIWLHTYTAERKFIQRQIQRRLLGDEPFGLRWTDL